VDNPFVAPKRRRKLLDGNDMEVCNIGFIANRSNIIIMIFSKGFQVFGRTKGGLVFRRVGF